MAAISQSNSYVSIDGEYQCLGKFIVSFLHSCSTLRVSQFLEEINIQSMTRYYFERFRYKKMEDRAPMDDVMIVILPILFQRLMQLFAHHDSDQSALIQKQILKIFHAYTQVSDVLKQRRRFAAWRWFFSF